MPDTSTSGSVDDARLLIPYWLRAVRIGLEATAVVLVTLVLFPFLPGTGHIDTPVYAAVVAAGVAGAVAVALLPWRRLFEGGPWGVRLLYAWSIADITLVSIAVAATGGGASELFVVYALTSVFFGAAYPPSGQLMLLIYTEVAYLGALFASGWNVSAAELFLQLSVLATLTLLTSFMFRELLERMRSQEEARVESERWADLLSSVAGATREMRLHPGGILDATVAAVQQLGFEGASISEVDALTGTWRVVRAAGMPRGTMGRPFELSQGLTGRVVTEERTVALAGPDAGEALFPVRAADFPTGVVTPVWVGGVIAYTIAAGHRDERSLLRREVQAVETLAQHVGLALENATRFEAEHRMVQRLSELDRMKSDFLTTVSHELRTPVTVIRGVGTTLERMWGSLDAATTEQMLNGLSENARSLEEVITTLLDFSGLQAGRTEAAMQPVALSVLVEATAARFAEEFAGRDVELDLRPGLRVKADPALLDRAMDHLVQNALRHTPTGTAVRIESRVDGKDAVVSVTDRGQGISHEELPHLTKQFFRGGDINTRPRGLGLGLALVVEMLELMGSTLEIDSAPGWGSRFAFRLELIEDVAGGRGSASSGGTARRDEAGTSR